MFQSTDCHSITKVYKGIGSICGWDRAVSSRFTVNIRKCGMSIFMSNISLARSSCKGSSTRIGTLTINKIFLDTG